MKILVTMGTRPEAIKLAPVALALRKDHRFQPVICSTGQHRQMLDQVLSLFAISPDVELDLMRPNQSLADLHTRAMERLDRIYRELSPQLVLVQGDTSTAMVGAMTAFYLGIPVAHVEAGLRTHDIYHPFPEEANRRVISSVAQLHFAPTSRAVEVLRREGHADSSIFLTGNTVIDALLWIRRKLRDEERQLYRRDGLRLVLVTAHRRESFGEPFRDICRSLVQLVKRNPDIWMLYPVHLNPNVQKVVSEFLSGQERIQLTDPLPYNRLTAAMDEATLILTDSGGIQEEAPSLGKPVLVLREKTERPEAVEAGTSIVVGRDPAVIVEQAERLLGDETAYLEVARRKNPFGDGKATERILQAIRDRLGSS